MTIDRAALVVALAATLAAGSVFARSLRADAIERRGGEPRIVGEILSADDAEVVIKSALGATHRVSWDRILRLEPEAQGENARRLEAGERLWRARGRVERHDTALAEPLFERHFEATRGTTSETALVVAEGLLRCRLARGAHDGAVFPALEVARLRRAGVETESYALLPSVFDAEMALCPRLPPAWVASRALDGLERDLGEYDARGDEVVAALAALYGRCLRTQLGREADEASNARRSNEAEHAGVALLESIAGLGVAGGADAAGADERAAARRSAQNRLDDATPWAQAWLRFAIGSALVREPDVGERRRGLVELIHVPANHGSSQPYLAGLALALVAETCERDGDVESASAVRTELARAFPDHPALAASRAVPPTIEAP